jgi:hypothetical protein
MSIRRKEEKALINLIRIPEETISSESYPAVANQAKKPKLLSRSWNTILSTSILNIRPFV